MDQHIAKKNRPITKTYTVTMACATDTYSIGDAVRMIHFGDSKVLKALLYHANLRCPYVFARKKYN